MMGGGCFSLGEESWQDAFSWMYCLTTTVVSHKALKRLYDFCWGPGGSVLWLISPIQGREISEKCMIRQAGQ